MSETKPEKKTKSLNPSSSAQALDSVELLIDKNGEQEQASPSPQKPSNTSEFEQAVEQAISEVLPSLIRKAFDDCCNIRFDKLDKKFASLERTFQDQCKTVNGFVTKLNAVSSPEAEACANSNSGPSTESLNEKQETALTNDDPTSHWQQQKQAMLAQYDATPGTPPLGQPGTESEKLATDQSNAPTELTPATDEIEKLEAELNSKLREVEIELSINRARLSQERAEFERNQADLDRRSSELDAKLAAMNSDGDDVGGTDLMDRFKRHLGT